MTPIYRGIVTYKIKARCKCGHEFETKRLVNSDLDVDNCCMCSPINLPDKTKKRGK